MRRLLSLLIICLCLGPGLSGRCAPGTELLLPSAPPVSPRVQTVKFQSKLINTTLPYNVILPVDYDAAGTTRYPVLYLLHGLTGHYTDWLTRTNIADYAAEYRLIVVMPEGNDGWYIDGPNDNEKYESYILRELIPDVQQRYRTIDARYGRAIAGLSMGGYGAIRFGLKSPGTFVFAGSMSGAFGITRFTERDISGTIWQSTWKLFGPLGSDTRKSNDLLDVVNALTPQRIAGLPFLYLDCGTEDSVFFPANGELAGAMAEKKVPHEYRQLPGDHSWTYWDRQVQEVLKIAATRLRFPPAGRKSNVR